MSARPKALVWPLILVVLATTLYVGARRRRDFVDFLVYRTAAERALHAEPLYRESDGHYQYKYWPAFALAMAPFALLPSEASRVLWYALLCGLLVAYIGWAIRELPDRRLSHTTLTVVVSLLLAKSIVQELVNGQTNVLLGTLLLAAYVAARKRQSRLAGVLVGVAMFVKPYAAILVPWLAVVCGSTALLSSTVAAGALLLAPAAVYGWNGNLGQLADWCRTVASTTAPNLLFPENISLASMWAKWLGAGTLASSIAAISVVALLAGAVAVWTKRGAVRQPLYLELAFLLLAIPLVSPQGWDYVLLLGAPAFICIVDRFREMSTTVQAVAAAGLVLTSLTIFDLLGRSLYSRLTGGWSVVTIGALLMAAAIAHLRWRALA